MCLFLLIMLCIIFILFNLQYCVFFRASAKAAVVLLPVLGLTWVFGLLAVNEDTVAFAWIFTILNSLQVNKYKPWW